MGTVHIILDSCRFDTYQAADKNILKDAIRARACANHTVPVFVEAVCYGRIPGDTRTGPATIHLLDDADHTYFYTDNVHLHPAVSPVKELHRKFTDYRCFDTPYNSLDRIVSAANKVRLGDNDIMWLWTGNTHQPYSWFDDRFTGWPELKFHYTNQTMTQPMLDRAKARQVAMCQLTMDYIEQRLWDHIKGHTVYLWGDHGELFGEDGLFGHGGADRSHPHVYDVPLVKHGGEHVTTV